MIEQRHEFGHVPGPRPRPAFVNCRACGSLWLWTVVAAHVPETWTIRETMAERICSTCGSDNVIKQIQHGEFEIGRPASGRWRDFFKGDVVIITCPNCLSKRDAEFLQFMVDTRKGLE